MAHRPRRSTVSEKRTIGQSFQAALTDDPWSRAIIKATDSKRAPPKLKHVKALVSLSFRRDVPVNDIAQQLTTTAETSKSWIVVLKTLVVVHKMLRNASSPFCQAIATETTALGVDRFHDSKQPFGPEMTQIIHAYGAYLSFHLGLLRKHGFTPIHAGATGKCEFLTGKPSPKTSAFIQDMQGSQDALFEVIRSIAPAADSAASAKRAERDELLQDLIVQDMLKLVVNDGLRLFSIVNDAMIAMLATFFTTMPKLECAAHLELYEKFTQHCLSLDDLVDLAKRFALVGPDVPELSQAPLSIIDKLRSRVSNYGTSIANPGLSSPAIDLSADSAA
eukprot:m.48175 g.48175  ORF g.48175 m.48175 type:complete len:334 (-) comp11014_c0_seq1:138-1139(-)